MDDRQTTPFTVGYPLVGDTAQPYIGLATFDLTVPGLTPPQMIALHRRLQDAIGTRWSQELAGIVRDVVKASAPAGVRA